MSSKKYTCVAKITQKQIYIIHMVNPLVNHFMKYYLKQSMSIELKTIITFNNWKIDSVARGPWVGGQC